LWKLPDHGILSFSRRLNAMGTMNIDPKLPETKILSTERDKYNDILIRVETTEDHVHCRMCKEKIYKRHGSDRERKLKHLPVFGDQTYI
jgi:hypothetical protein